MRIVQYKNTHTHTHTQSYHLHFYFFCLSTVLLDMSALVCMCGCVLISKLCGWVCNHLPAAFPQLKPYRSTQYALNNFNSASACHRYLAAAPRLNSYLSIVITNLLQIYTHSYLLTSLFACRLYDAHTTHTRFSSTWHTVYPSTVYKSRNDHYFP